MAFTKMDELQQEDVAVIAEALTRRQAALPQRIKSMLLSLEEQVDGFPVNELEHSLQTATRALRAGASEEMVVAALCHDIGKTISIANHSGISAEILKPYVSQETYDIVRTHTDFQARYYNGMVGRDPNIYQKYADQPWCDLACRFSDEWDEASFDPSYDSLPLEYFEPMIDRVLALRTEGNHGRTTGAASPAEEN
jgi:predicted HD phosphohydrolase